MSHSELREYDWQYDQELIRKNFEMGKPFPSK